MSDERTNLSNIIDKALEFASNRVGVLIPNDAVKPVTDILFKQLPPAYTKVTFIKQDDQIEMSQQTNANTETTPYRNAKKRRKKHAFGQRESDDDTCQILKSKLLEFINSASIRNPVTQDLQAARLYNNAMHLYVNKQYLNALETAIDCMKILVDYHPSDIGTDFCELQSSLERLKSEF